jgi:hypothetical protein
VKNICLPLILDSGGYLHVDVSSLLRPAGQQAPPLGNGVSLDFVLRETTFHNIILQVKLLAGVEFK